MSGFFFFLFFFCVCACVLNKKSCLSVFVRAKVTPFDRDENFKSITWKYCGVIGSPIMLTLKRPKYDKYDPLLGEGGTTAYLESENMHWWNFDHFSKCDIMRGNPSHKEMGFLSLASTGPSHYYQIAIARFLFKIHISQNEHN